MADSDRDPRAVHAYLRLRDEVAERRVVAEAEGVLGGVWIGELEDARRVALGRVAANRMAWHLALEGVRRAQRSGSPAELARAHGRLAALEEASAADLDEARTVLAGVDRELENAGRAGIERGRRVQRDCARLRTAWSHAYRTAAPGTD